MNDHLKNFAGAFASLASFTVTLAQIDHLVSIVCGIFGTLAAIYALRIPIGNFWKWIIRHL